MNVDSNKSLLLAILYLAVGAYRAESSKASRAAKPKVVAPGVLQVGLIVHPRVTESSGIAASGQYPGVFWTHNDGGGFKKPILYGMNREGKILGGLPVAGALPHRCARI